MGNRLRNVRWWTGCIVAIGGSVLVLWDIAAMAAAGVEGTISAVVADYFGGVPMVPGLGVFCLGMLASHFTGFTKRR